MNERIDEQKRHWDSLATSYDKYFGYDTAEGQRKIARKVKLIIELGEITDKDIVLEIGCGTGVYTQKLAANAKNIQAIDLSREMMNKAPMLTNVVYQFGDAHKLPYLDKSFDVVVGCYVLQYLDLSVALPEIARVLKPEGRAVFLEPNALNPVAYVITRWGLIRNLLHRPSHNTSFFSWELRMWFERYGISNTGVKSLEFLPNQAVASGIINQILGGIPLINTLGGSLIVYGRKNGSEKQEKALP